jgi:chorismate synthase
MLRWLTAGESHGVALVAICAGMPAGAEVTTADLASRWRRLAWAERSVVQHG